MEQREESGDNALGERKLFATSENVIVLARANPAAAIKPGRTWFSAAAVGR